MNWQARKLHLIGIGGAGMSALALVAHELGAGVTGSDRAASSYTERLAAAGIPVAIGHDPANVPSGAEIVVSTAIGDDNPELALARAEGRTVLHRSDLLRELVAAKPTCVAVAGAHGKTTTTAMIGHVLTELNRDPAIFVGGEVKIAGELTNARWGSGDVAVVEADESDGSFLKLDPAVAVVTNVEVDHHAAWQGGLEELMAAFAKFAAPAREVVIWRGQRELAELAPGDRLTGFAIGGEPAGPRDLLAASAETPDDPARGTTIQLADGRTINLSVRGEHNALNALAALAALRAIEVPVETAIPALESFAGVGRRFEYVGDSPQGAHIYDDYAHHPTELRAALKTARQTAAGGRVVVAFQPHLYSRTASLADEFGAALGEADVAVVLDVYPARELAADFPGVDGALVAAKATAARPELPVHSAPTKADAVQLLRGELRAGDLLITLGAGDVFEVGRALLGEDEA